MKKITFISLFIFWSVVTAVLTAGLVLNNRPGNANNPAPAGLALVNGGTADPAASGNTGAAASQAALNRGGIVLDLSEVAKHNVANDCWMIINNQVYDLSPYLGQHPGGASSMALYCGADGTTAFTTKDKRDPQSHSQLAEELLKNYYIGPVGTAISRAPDTAGNPAAAAASQAAAVNKSLPKTDLAVLPPANPATGPLSQTIQAGTAPVLTSVGVAAHNSVNDCWLIINNQVYNLTPYFGQHPGGTAAITPYCGADGTAAFAGQGHSAFASGLLDNYYVGALGTAPAPVIQNTAAETVQPAPAPAETNSTNPAPAPLPAVSQSVSLNTATIAQHNSVNDCWLIINNQVYNLTPYFGQHPGGTAAITPYCGADGTAAFAGQGHSAFASGLLDSYYIGNVGSTAEIVVNSPSTANPAVNPPITGGEHEDEDEHEEYEDDD